MKKIFLLILFIIAGIILSSCEGVYEVSTQPTVYYEYRSYYPYRYYNPIIIKPNYRYYNYKNYRHHNNYRHYNNYKYNRHHKR